MGDKLQNLVTRRAQPLWSRNKFAILLLRYTSRHILGNHNCCGLFAAFSLEVERP